MGVCIYEMNFEMKVKLIENYKKRMCYTYFGKFLDFVTKITSNLKK